MVESVSCKGDAMTSAAQSLDAGSVAALPEGLRVELEGVEDAGGVRFLQEMAAQLRVCCACRFWPPLAPWCPMTCQQIEVL